jgi:predicted CopG family antitoxin
MVTSIQLNENVKSALEKLKGKSNESYEDVIVKLLEKEEREKRNQRELMVEGCKEMYADMKRINKEWELVDSDFDWEWDESESK